MYFIFIPECLIWGKLFGAIIHWDDPLEKEMATHSSNPMDKGAWWTTVPKSWTQLGN